MSPNELLEGLGRLGYTRSLTRTTDITILEFNRCSSRAGGGVTSAHCQGGKLIRELGVISSSKQILTNGSCGSSLFDCFVFPVYSGLS